MGESQMREMAREQNEGTTLEEYQRRLASVEQVMTKRGIDCILINASHSIKYLTGADNTCSWVFITRKGRRVAIKEAGRSPCALYHRTQQKHEGTLEQLCLADSKNLLGCSHNLSEASRTMDKAKKPISAYTGSY